MAVTTVETNNKLIKFSKEINREFVRENLFSPYMGTELNSIIRNRYELKDGGEQLNIPMVTKLTGNGVGAGTLVGNEEKIDNYGMRMYVDWARHAVAVKKSEQQKDSADIFGEAKPLLSDWGKERQRDNLIEALMALPTESAPAGLGTDTNQNVNGILYDQATAAQRNTWNVANTDRIVYGKLASNYNATHATALATLDTTDDLLTAGKLEFMKRKAETPTAGFPKIRPFKTKDGYEYYVCFVGSNTFRDLRADLATVNKDARPREGRGFDENPIFQDGDLMVDGVIVRKIPEISTYVTNVWTTLKTAGNGSGRVEPVFFCGQQAAAIAWGQMAKPTFRKEDDYGFITGTGIEMCYGAGKMFKKTPGTGTDLIQWGMVTGFFAAPVDA